MPKSADSLGRKRVAHVIKADGFYLFRLRQADLIPALVMPDSRPLPESPVVRIRQRPAAD